MINKNYTYCWNFKIYYIVCSGFGTTMVWDLPWTIQVYLKYMEKIKIEELIILCVSYSEFGAIIAYNPRLYILRLNSTSPQF